MRVTLLRKIDRGGYGDVWEANDELDRRLAVKFVRESNDSFSNAQQHARALARLNHPNVVRLHGMEQLMCPDTQATRDALVMEFLDGKTLDERLSQPLTAAEAQKIAVGLCDGLEAIHDAGLIHHDLHGGNVLICEGEVKIIDILYRGTLQALPTLPRQHRVADDLKSLARLIKRAFRQADLPDNDVEVFSKAVANADQASLTIAQIRALVAQIASTKQVSADKLDELLARLKDPLFSDTKGFADALAADTPNAVIDPLLRGAIQQAVITRVHKRYLHALWTRADQAQRSKTMKLVGSELDKQIPSGEWHPLFLALVAFGSATWQDLPTISRLRAERAILDDLSEGYFDTHAAVGTRHGSMGTWIARFGPYFDYDHQKLAVSTLEKLLKGNWYSQNYVAEHLFSSLAKLCKTPRDEERLIDAIRSAKRNDAHRVTAKIDRLPIHWQESLRDRSEQDDQASPEVSQPNPPSSVTIDTISATQPAGPTNAGSRFSRLPSPPDVRALVGLTRTEVDRALGPSTAHLSVKPARVGPALKCIYLNGRVEIVFIDGRADWIMLNALGDLNFSAGALRHLGFKTVTLPTSQTDYVMLWKGLEGLHEVQLFALPDGQCDYIYIKAFTG